jgi:hypothetical protein
MWLNDEQLVQLTRRKQPSAQIRALVAAGIPFKVVSGRPIVVLSDLDGSGKKVRKL